MTYLIEKASFIQASKKLLPLALPMAGTQLITFSSGFLCMVMLAQLGQNVLAASALIFSSLMSILIIGMSILFSLSLLVGHAYGANNHLAIGRFFQQSWMLSILIGIPLMIIFWYIGPILMLAGQPKSIVAIVTTFFHAHTLRVIPVMLCVCNQQLCYGVHKQKIDFLANIIGLIVLLITAYILILGKLGFPSFGVIGLAYAMTAQTFCYLLITTLFLYYEDSFKRFQLFNYRLNSDWHYLTQMLKVGWPISMQVSGEMLSFLVSTAMIGWLGINALAAYQIVIQYLFLAFTPIFTLSQASSILVGQACGGKQFDDIKTLGYTSILFALIISLIAAALFIFMPKALASLYLDTTNPNNKVILHLTVLLFAATAISLIFDGVRNVMTGALRGLFDTKFPMLMGLLVIWLIGIPLGYFLAFTLHRGAMGIVAGSAFAMFIGATIVIYRWHVLTKQYGPQTNKFSIEISNPFITQMGVNAINDFYQTLAASQLKFDGLNAYLTGCDSPFLNVVIDTRTNEKINPDILKSITHLFNHSNVPWAWFLTATAKMHDLEQHGFTLLEESPAMYYDLSKLVPVTLPDSIRIEEMDTHDDLSRWIKVQSEGFPSADDCEQYRKINADLLNNGEKKLKHYIAYYQNEVATAATLFLSDNAVMLHNMATKKQFRQRGIGEALTLHIMSVAKQLKFNHLFLDASDEAFKLYQRIGFQVYCVTKVYVKNS